MEWREHKKVEEYITVSEAQTIIRECKRERDRLIIRVMWETGARINEANKLTPDRIDKDNNCLILPNLKQKEFRLKRVYLFPESTLCQDLLDFSHGNDLLFTNRQGKPLTELYVWRLLCREGKGICYVNRILKIKRGAYKPAWPHLLRHGAGMNMLRRTGRLDVVQEQLGHSTIVTTQIYAQVSDEDRKNIISST